MSRVIRGAGWAVVVATVIVTGHGQAQDKKPADPPKKPPTVMQRKLAHAQKLLEGLALNDFEKMRKEADALQQCAREASWQVLKTPKYELFSNDFQRQMEAIQKAAKNKNVDAAALAYVEATLTCVKCHQYVREEGIGLAPPAARDRAGR